MTIDAVLAIANHQAERERKSLGEVISALASQGLRHGPVPPAVVRNGLPSLPLKPASTTASATTSAVTVTPVTLELVNRLSDELA